MLQRLGLVKGLSSEQRPEGIGEVDQLRFLMGVFPRVPGELLKRVCVPRLSQIEDMSRVPSNRRFRRSMNRAKPESVIVNCAVTQSGWKGLGRVAQVSDSSKGLGSGEVFRKLLQWAEAGVIGEVIQGTGSFERAELEGTVVGPKVGEGYWSIEDVGDPGFC